MKTEISNPPYIFHVKLFGPVAKTAGATSAEIMATEPDMEVRQLIESLCHQKPLIAPMVRSSRIARNHSFAGENERVSFTDELALIGMVSGG